MFNVFCPDWIHELPQALREEVKEGEANQCAAENDEGSDEDGGDEESSDAFKDAPYLKYGHQKRM